METEVKLNALHLPDAAAVLRDSWLSRLFCPGSLRQVEMESCYYDTQAKSLAARGYALRLRRENRQPVMTLKGGGQASVRGLHHRREWTAQLTAGESDIFVAHPDGSSAAALLRKNPCRPDPELLLLLQGEKLIETARITFIRQAADLVYKTARIELALDQGILSCGGMSAPLCELELELQQGEAADLVALGQLLAERFGLQPENSSKLARCLQLAENGV